MRFKFVHAADLHLDTPFRGVPADSGLTGTFQQATFRAFSRIVDLCLREHVAFLLLAGDLFDAKDRSVRARLVLRRELERLDVAGIQTFIVHGNHDPLS
ncbi:MAG TPA: metallophosphoesterase, partial [Archangium sp.]|nr:metallophosphoesterase [Archangium sp.]